MEDLESIVSHIIILVEWTVYLKRIGYERDGTSSSNIKMIEDAVGVC